MKNKYEMYKDKVTRNILNAKETRWKKNENLTGERENMKTKEKYIYKRVL